MKKKVTIVMLVFIIAALILSACSMPAPKPVTTAKKTPTPGGEIPFPVPTQSDLVKDILNATQTAIALENGGAGSNSTLEAPAQQGGGEQGSEADATAVPQDEASQAGGGAPGVRATAKPPRNAPAEPNRPTSYAVKKGDHIYCLARRFNVAPGDLLAANGGNTMIFPGQTLNVPQSSAWPSSLGSRSLRAHPGSYTVLSGDTLNKIACIYGDIYPEQIAEFNDLEVSAVPAAGTTLDIP